MPFKVLILTSALASVDQNYYNAARIDGTSKFRIFTRITLPLISPDDILSGNGFIGAFKAYKGKDVVSLFGTDLNAAEMNTIVGYYIYDMLYGNSGGYPSFCIGCGHNGGAPSGVFHQ